MAARLTLDQKGMKGPLDIGSPAAQAVTQPPAEPVAKPAKTSAASKTATARKPRPPRASRGADAKGTTPDTTVEQTPAAANAGDDFGGYPVQTSIRFDLALFQRADNLSREAGVSLAALLLAALSQDTPTDPTAGAELAISERLDHADAIRIERNIRMPRDVRSRLDELVAPYERSLRGARSLLINALLRDRLPDNADAARALTQAYVRQQTLATLQLNA